MRSTFRLMFYINRNKVKYIRARNPEEAVRGHGQVRRGNPRFETYPLIPKQSLSCAVHSSSYSTSTVTR